jgi:RNA polymerase sigma factor (TIGR02999 family)
MTDFTPMLQAVERGEDQAYEKLLPLVYDELRRLAAARMAREAAGQTLQATALVHEAWIRLVEHGSQTWENRAHFFGAASEAMRRILIEQARRKARLRHGGGQERVAVQALDSLSEATPDEKLLLINQALEQLEAEYPERAKVVVLKYFGGLTNQEVAKTMGISRSSVDRHWFSAKAWLYRKLREEL